MKKLIFTLCYLSMFLAVTAQERDKQQLSNSVTISKENYWNEQLQELYEPGISMSKDSMYVSTEAKKVMQDSAYRALIFPAAYKWPTATQFLKQLEFKKGFWYLIKLYAQDTANRQLVVETIIAYDNFFEITKALTGTFYTYALLDPNVCIFKNNKIKITRPDILEGEFNKVKEMIAYITSYRSANTVLK